MAVENKFTIGQMKLQITLTGETNYRAWESQLQLVLNNEEFNQPNDGVRYDYYTAYNANFEGRNIAQNPNRIINHRIMMLMKLSVSERISSEIANKHTVVEIKNHLQAKYVPQQSGVYRLRQNLYNIKYKGGDINSYFQTIRDCITQTETAGSPVPQLEHTAIILNGLQDEHFRSLKTFLETNPPQSNEALENRIRTHYAEQQSNQPIANYHRKGGFRGKPKYDRKSSRNEQKCDNCPSLRNHTTENCKKYCSNCKTKTHFTSQCRKGNKGQRRSNVALEIDDEPAETFSFAVNARKECADWMLDSACNIHLTNKLENLSEPEKYRTKIMVGNSNYMFSTHKGNTEIPGTNF